MQCKPDFTAAGIRATFRSAAPGGRLRRRRWAPGWSAGL